jgi:hypothetical protein
VAYVEIVGSLVAAISVLLRAVLMQLASVWFPALIAMAFFAVTGTGGGLLLRRKRAGTVLSVVAQLLQVVQIETGNLRYAVVAGPYLVSTRHGGWTGLKAGFEGTFMFFVRGGAHPESTSHLVVNFLPLVLLVLLRMAQPRQVRHHEQ